MLDGSLVGWAYFGIPFIVVVSDYSSTVSQISTDNLCPMTSWVVSNIYEGRHVPLPSLWMSLSVFSWVWLYLIELNHDRPLCLERWKCVSSSLGRIFTFNSWNNGFFSIETKDLFVISMFTSLPSFCKEVFWIKVWCNWWKSSLKQGYDVIGGSWAWSKSMISSWFAL